MDQDVIENLRAYLRDHQPHQGRPRALSAVSARISSTTIERFFVTSVRCAPALAGDPRWMEAINDHQARCQDTADELARTGDGHWPGRGASAIGRRVSAWDHPRQALAWAASLARRPPPTLTKDLASVLGLGPPTVGLVTRGWITRRLPAPRRAP